MPFLALLIHTILFMNIVRELKMEEGNYCFRYKFIIKFVMMFQDHGGWRLLGDSTPI